MGLFELVAVLLVLAALFSYANHRWIGLPTTIGVMLIALSGSLLLVVLHAVGFAFDEQAEAVLATIDFEAVLLHGMLGFLLFAGALHVDLNDLASQRGPIAAFATIGLLLSTALVGLLAWGVLQLVGLPLPFAYCFVFGALISPTDPIAVLGILKAVGVRKSIETKITGESLFNDGLGVVLFLVLLEFAQGGHEATVGHAAALLAQETLGGAALGLLAGLAAYRMLMGVDEYQVEVLVTLALVMGTYTLAHALHLSGPIAVVIAGLLIGNHGRSFAMSERTREHLDTFWELVDEILNAILFLLIGLELLVLDFTPRYLLGGALIIPVVLAARWAAVSVPIAALRRWRTFSPYAVRILTWGGLRGGISVALALSLPRGPEREVIVAITYAVVVFSILVQGTTVRRVVGDAALAE